MHKLSHKLLAYTLILTLACTALVINPAWADNPYHHQTSPYPPTELPYRKKPSAELMIFDGLVIRPLMLGVTIAGTGLFIATLPFSLLGSNVDQAAQRLVVEPAEWVFVNCLGCIPPHHYRTEYPHSDTTR